MLFAMLYLQCITMQNLHACTYIATVFWTSEHLRVAKVTQQSFTFTPKNVIYWIIITPKESYAGSVLHSNGI